MRTLLLFTLTLALLAGCSTPTQVISTDLTRQSGVFVVGYVDREDIRIKLEEQFVADLTTQGIRAVPSNGDISLIKKASTRDMVRAANDHDVVAILVINRVAADGADSLVESDQRIRPNDPDLVAYLDRTRTEADDYTADEPVFAEVNAFFVDGTKTRRFWTGTSWSFEGEEDDVIGDISQTIATELAKVAAEMRDYGRTID